MGAFIPFSTSSSMATAGCSGAGHVVMMPGRRGGRVTVIAVGGNGVTQRWLNEDRDLRDCADVIVVLRKTWAEHAQFVPTAAAIAATGPRNAYMQTTHIDPLHHFVIAREATAKIQNMLGNVQGMDLVICGWSGGFVTAVELARGLNAAGARVLALVACSGVPHANCRPLTMPVTLFYDRSDHYWGGALPAHFGNWADVTVYEHSGGHASETGRDVSQCAKYYEWQLENGRQEQLEHARDELPAQQGLSCPLAPLLEVAYGLGRCFTTYHLCLPNCHLLQMAFAEIASDLLFPIMPCNMPGAMIRLHDHCDGQ